MTPINHAIALAEKALRGRYRADSGLSRLRLALVAARRLILEGASDQAVMAALLADTTEELPIVEVEQLCGVRVAMAVASLAVWERGGTSRLLNDEFALCALFGRCLVEPGVITREVKHIAAGVLARAPKSALRRLAGRVLDHDELAAAA